jgi:hypothetical protein
MNTMPIMYIHVRKCKNIPVETVPGIRGGGVKESSGGNKFRYGIFDTL